MQVHIPLRRLRKLFGRSVLQFMQFLIKLLIKINTKGYIPDLMEMLYFLLIFCAEFHAADRRPSEKESKQIEIFSEKISVQPFHLGNW